MYQFSVYNSSAVFLDDQPCKYRLSVPSSSANHVMVDTARQRQSSKLKFISY